MHVRNFRASPFRPMRLPDLGKCLRGLSAAGLVAAGSVAGFVALPLFRLPLGPFEITITLVALLALPGLYLLRDCGESYRRWFLVACGCTLQGIVYLAIEPRRIDPLTVIGGLVCVTAYALALKMSRATSPRLARDDLLFIVGTAVVTVAAYRWFALALGDVPNERRSLVLAGVEVHHLNVGLLLALALSLIPTPSAVIMRLAFVAAVGFALGGVVDQSTFFLYAQLGDSEYNSAFSWVGPIMQIILLLAIALSAPSRSGPIT